jgi:hypothetical protein
MATQRRPSRPLGALGVAAPLPPDADALWQVLHCCQPTEGGIMLTLEDRQRLLNAAVARFGGERPMVKATIAAYLAPFLVGSRSLVLLDVQRPLLLAALTAAGRGAPVGEPPARDLPAL